MSHARQVDTTYLQVDCTLKLRNTSNGTWHTKERLSLCLPKEADIAFFFASGVAGQRRNLSCPSWVTHRRMCECAVSSPPFFFVHYPLPWSRGSPNNVDDMHEQVMPVLVNVSECNWEKRDVESAKGKGAWELLFKGLTPKYMYVGLLEGRALACRSQTQTTSCMREETTPMFLCPLLLVTGSIPGQQSGRWGQASLHSFSSKTCYLM